MLENPPKIKIGDFIILQRQKYMKLHKFGNIESSAALGKDQLELRNIEGHPYCSTFKMIPKETRGRQRITALELCSDKDMQDIRDIMNNAESGADNRNIKDDGGSQKLGNEEILKLREDIGDSKKIIGTLVENSTSFQSKTVYSQEKYLKRKEKKYFEYVQIRQPSIRMLAEIFYRQDPDKIMGLRIDSLSQIISYSDVNAFGKFLLFESGTNGLLPAAFLNAIGSGTKGKLVHMHPGNVPQKQAIQALNLPQEQLDRCVSVNIYSVLREFYQGKEEEKANVEEETEESAAKRPKLEEGENNTDEKSKSDEKVKPDEKSQKWKLENKKACDLMKEKFDSLIVVSRDHPLNIVKELLQFIKPGRPVIVFNLSKELLMEMYVELKMLSTVTNLHLTSNWMRYYQILPNRTHPEVQMSGNSGYILRGTSIN
ncbi:TRMT6 family protein [Megaselia abdita]